MYRIKKVGKWAPLTAGALGITICLLTGCSAPSSPGSAGATTAGTNNSSAYNSGDAAYLPDPRLTPGDTLPVTAQDVCTPGYARRVRNVPLELNHQVYQEYGMYHHTPRQYEVDHLISLELGGSNSIRNLWPQPYFTQPWNAHVKDQLENQLHREVCSGQIDLTLAQKEIASDWIAAYKQVFHTDKPLADRERKRYRRGGFYGGSASPPPAAAPANGSVDQVWVNTNSGKFFQPGSRYYGNTRQGEYLAETQAEQQGFIPAKE